MSSGPIERPPLKIEITLDNGETQEIKMSYGLFNDLQRAIQEPTQIIETVMADPYTRDYIFRRCFTDTKRHIKDESELIPEEDMPVGDPEQLDKLLQWVSRHMLYFFATSAGGLKQLAAAFKAAMPSASEAQPDPSTSGSES